MPSGAAPGVIVLQNMKWPGMHIKITKKGKVESVSLCGWEVRVSCGRVPNILSNVLVQSRVSSCIGLARSYCGPAFSGVIELGTIASS